MDNDLKSQLRSIHARRREHLNAIAVLDAEEARLIGEPVGLRKGFSAAILNGYVLLPPKILGGLVAAPTGALVWST